MKFKYPIIKNNVIKDNRGSLLEIFHNKRFKEKFLLHYSLPQKNVFRGLHFQKSSKQNLLLLSGKITDYCLDLRKNQQNI